MRGPHTTPFEGVEGIQAWDIEPRAGELQLEISRERPPAPTEAVLAQWNVLLAQNPRMYDGGVLSVLTFDPEHNTIHARRDSFQRLAVQPKVPTGVRLFAVTAALTAHDSTGREYILLGRRGTNTRVFGGMWEIGPSGGVGLPPANIQQLSYQDIAASLREEISEEIGLELPALMQGTPIAYLRDHIAFSDDLLIRYSLGLLDDVSHLARPRNWEYSEVLWLPTDTVSAFDTPETIAATRAAFRMLRWLDRT